MSDKETKERIERDAIALATAISSNPFMNKADIKNPEGKKHRPDFPEWIKSKEGEDCLKWPISEVKYLHNRLFWAFDAGRNCVWDQYITKKAELQKAKELNGELVGYLKRIMTREIFKEHFNIEQVEELIKKSES